MTSTQSSSYYEGGFINGLRHGKGTFQYFNGSIYEGDFEKGLRHGYGVLKSTRLIYSGSWDHDKMHG